MKVELAKSFCVLPEVAFMEWLWSLGIPGSSLIGVWDAHQCSPNLLQPCPNLLSPKQLSRDLKE